MHLNLKSKVLKDAMLLTKTGTHLSYTLDITTCQNDKLLYICAPVLGKSVKCSLKEERIQLIVKDSPTLPATIVTTIDLGTVKKMAFDYKNILREAMGMSRMRNSNTYDGELQIITDVSEMTITGRRETDDFVYYNLNGGDSWSYYHPKANHEYLYCFKHPDEVFRMKDILKSEYNQLEKKRKLAASTPTEAGEILLAFSDINAGNYWRGSWNEATHELRLNPCNRTDLNDWMLEHGKPELEYIPTWTRAFDPQCATIYDPDNKIINTYVPEPQMLRTYTTQGSKDSIPMTLRTFMHMLNCGPDDEELEHFLNWLAVIFQKKIKTLTAWVVLGTEGTGKGVTVNDIIKPCMGQRWVAHTGGSILEDKFNGWLENKLFVSLNEVDIMSSGFSKKIREDLKHYITEPTVQIRQMHQTAYESYNYSNFLLSTNETEPLHIGENNRRYNIGRYQSDPIGYTLEEVEAVRAENDAFLHYIMTRPADVKYAGTVLQTDAVAQLKEKSRSSIDDVTMKLKQGDFMEFFMTRPDIQLEMDLRGMNSSYAAHFETIIKREAADIVTLGKQLGEKFITLDSKLTREELMTVYMYMVGGIPTSPAKFTQFVKHRGLTITPMKRDNKMFRGFALRWILSIEHIQHLQEFVAPQQPKLKAVK